MPIISPTAISPYRIGGKSWSAYWATRTAMGYFPSSVASALDTPDWYVDSAATGAGTGADWTNAFTTIGAAYTAATAGDVIEVSGGIEGKTYTEDINIVKAVTIQGSNVEGHNGLVTHTGYFYSHNTEGVIKIKNLKQQLTGADKYQFYAYASSEIEFHDVYFGPLMSVSRSPETNGGKVTFIRCTINRPYRSNNTVSYAIYPSAASVIEYQYCLFDHAGLIPALPAGSKLTMNHCTVLASGKSIADSFVDIGNSATTTVEVTNSVFFGVHPIKSGAASKAPVVTNVFWHKTPNGTGSTTFDSSNRATITNAITGVNPLFKTPKNTVFGDLMLRIDDKYNLANTETACATLNPELKVTHNVEISGFDASTRPTAAQIDIMRRLIAAGNEIGCHGSTHCSLDSLNCISISATGTTPLLTIDTTQVGDSSTWSGTLSITINSVTENFDLTTYKTLGALITALNGNSIGDGVVTAAKIGTNMSNYLFTCCLADVTDQAISAAYTILLDDAAFNRFEVTEGILDLEAYINSATDRNGNNAIAGTSEAAPDPAYVCKTYATAYTTGRASVLALLKANANLVGAWGGNGTAVNTGRLYEYGANTDLFTFPSDQAPSDASLFAMCCAMSSGPLLQTALYHGIPTYGGTTAGFKAIIQMFGLGTKTFSEIIEYIRADGGWTITNDVAAFTGTYGDYMSRGDYRLQIGSPLTLS